MINPFISIDYQLHEIGWNKFYEGSRGFMFIKAIGKDVTHKAHFHDNIIRFTDEEIIGHDYDSIDLNDKELELFAKKIKEWRRINERINKSGRHYSEKR